MTPEQTLHSTDMDVCKLCHDDNWNDQELTDDTQAYIRIAIQMSESQSDTGANRHLTNMKHAIKECQPVSPFSIGTIEEHSSVTVMGKGFTSIQTTDPRNPLIYETLCSPKASGSVFSPEKYAADNKSTIDSWYQYGHVTNKKGAIQFFKDDKLVATIPLYRRNGLWCMKISSPE